MQRRYQLRNAAVHDHRGDVNTKAWKAYPYQQRWEFVDATFSLGTLRLLGQWARGIGLCLIRESSASPIVCFHQWFPHSRMPDLSAGTQAQRSGIRPVLGSSQKPSKTQENFVTTTTIGQALLGGEVTLFALELVVLKSEKCE